MEGILGPPCIRLRKTTFQNARRVPLRCDLYTTTRRLSATGDGAAGNGDADVTC